MSSGPDQVSLADLLTRQVEGSRRLAETLEEAQTIFSGRDAAAIHEISQAIQRLYDAVETLEAERCRHLADADLAADRDGMAAYIQRHDGDGRLAKLWEELLESAGRCRDQNEINARIIEGSRHQAEAAFNILRGTPAGGNLYGPKGRTSTGGTSRPLAKA